MLRHGRLFPCPSLSANAAGNYLLGGGGNDTFSGLGGNDVLFGDNGAEIWLNLYAREAVLFG